MGLEFPVSTALWNRRQHQRVICSVHIRKSFNKLLTQHELVAWYFVVRRCKRRHLFGGSWVSHDKQTDHCAICLLHASYIKLVYTWLQHRFVYCHVVWAFTSRDKAQLFLVNELCKVYRYRFPNTRKSVNGPKQSNTLYDWDFSNQDKILNITEYFSRTSRHVWIFVLLFLIIGIV